MKSVITHFSYDHPLNPWVGGGGAYRDRETLLGFQSLGAKVTLVCAAFPEAKKDAKLSTKFIGYAHGGHLLNRLSYVVAAHFWLLRHRPKGIVAVSLSAYAPLWFGLIRQKDSYAVVHHRVGKEALKKYGILGWIAVLAEYSMFKSYQNFAISNRGTSAYIAQSNQSAKILITANGFNPKLLDVDPIQISNPYILYFGRGDIYMKGLDTLISAFGGIVKKNPNVRLLIAGHINSLQKEDLEDRLAIAEVTAQASIEANVSEERKATLYQECLFFCSPSRFEGWGISALEANAVGRAVVVSNAEGFMDSIAPGGACILVPIGQKEKLKWAMESLINSEEKRKALEARAKPWAKQFSWPQIIQREWHWIQNDFSESSTHNPTKTK